VQAALLWTENEERENARVLLDRIEQARSGTFPFTLILDDPSGNSAIISEKAEKKLLDTRTENP
jgi:zinc finger protein